MTLESVFVTGFSHHHLDINQRGLVSLTEDQQDLIYTQALKIGVQSVIILNTCNRTEIYGCGNLNQIKTIIQSIYGHNFELSNYLFIKHGEEAILHMLKVASGMDSKILGDLEILGQFKKSVAKAKSRGGLKGVMERITNQCISAAKEIRSKTNLTSGTVSAAYAVVKRIKDQFEDREIKILLIGTGKFGAGIAKNIVQHLANAKLVTTNRTNEKSEDLSKVLSTEHIHFNVFKEKLNSYDIVISSAHSDNGYLVNEQDINISTRLHLLIDMAVPLTIDPNIIKTNSNISLLNLDYVSEELQSTIDARVADLPLANDIITKHQNEIITWLQWHQKSGVVRMWKDKVSQLSNHCPNWKIKNDDERSLILEKNINNFARHLKSSKIHHENYEAIIQDFISIHNLAPTCLGVNLSITPLKKDCESCRIA
ncbi:MAG TPA: hypothetical protein PKD85_05310 [Saprospiraceae bacterium]|nr:hypothetical protein [Saprospiraceae bacterium]